MLQTEKAKFSHFDRTRGDKNQIFCTLEIHDILKKPYDQTNSVIIDFDLNYLGNCDLQISILGLDSGGVR